MWICILYFLAKILFTWLILELSHFHPSMKAYAERSNVFIWPPSTVISCNYCCHDSCCLLPPWDEIMNTEKRKDASLWYDVEHPKSVQRRCSRFYFKKIEMDLRNYDDFVMYRTYKQWRPKWKTRKIQNEVKNDNKCKYYVAGAATSFSFFLPLHLFNSVQVVLIFALSSALYAFHFWRMPHSTCLLFLSLGKRLLQRDAWKMQNEDGIRKN